MECKNITEKTAITWLDSNSATISISKFCIGCECNQILGNPQTMNFENTESGQKTLKKTVSEPYLRAILAIWNYKKSEQKIEENTEKTEI